MITVYKVRVVQRLNLSGHCYAFCVFNLSHFLMICLLHVFFSSFGEYWMYFLFTVSRPAFNVFNQLSIS